MDELLEIKEAVAEFTSSATERMTTIEEAFKEIQDQADRIETAMKRSPQDGAGRKETTASERESKALRTFAADGNDAELKALSVGVQPEGGYLVLPHMSSEMLKVMRDSSPIREIARVVPINSDSYEEPIDRNEIDAEWVSEKGARTETATADISMLRIPTHEIYAAPKVTQKLLDDSSINMEQWLSDKLADRFSRKEATGFVSGNGVGKPRGFLSYPVAATADFTRTWGTLEYVSTGHATLVTADGIVNLCYSLRAPYRAGAKWVMSRDTARQVRLLKDGQGQYLWREGLAEGQPDRLLGFPVVLAEDMPAIGAGNLAIAFGDWRRGYTVIDRLGIRFLRDPYSSKPHVILYGYKRVGGDVADFNAIKLAKVSAS